MKLTRPNDGYENASIEHVIRAAVDPSRVTGLTHNFYRYPARFSPVFARSVIQAFSKPGDWVLDPFAGGGTTLVEAMALGRHALGIDVSSLAAFVCEAKTAIVTDDDTTEFDNWRLTAPACINMHRPSLRCESYAAAGYYRNVEGKELWRLRKAIEQALATIQGLELDASKLLARCTVLRTAQWALDARRTRPSISEFRDQLSIFADEMISGAMELRDRLADRVPEQRPQAVSLNRSAAGAQTDQRVLRVSPPKLILTSPPYPGIHTLYHRWQVDGRRETPAPFWIAGKLDGAASSHYTMGDRKNPQLRSYFSQLEASFSSVAAVAGKETTIIQLVAFSDASAQLPKYLQVMRRCGLVEHLPWSFSHGDGRLWRRVPNRRWYTRQQTSSPGAREVVLVHRKDDLTHRP